MGLPIYYRNKLYSENERETLWIEKLNKEERYVKGQKIDISTLKGMIEYNNAQRYAAKIDERNGNLNEKYQFKRDRKKYEAQTNKISKLTKIIWMLKNKLKTFINK